MVYELAHIIKERLSFLWNTIEYCNSIAFAMRYKKKLIGIDKVVNMGVSYPYKMRTLEESDIPRLVDFFEKQPADAFRFFNPHRFDAVSLYRIVRNHSFLAFVLMEANDNAVDIVGYAFMRSFANGSSYRGYMVDAEHRGKGLAKTMGKGLNRVGDALGLKMYKSISPCNQASMKVTEAVCKIKILKTLKNGDYLIECMSKDAEGINGNVIGGGKYSSFQVVTLAAMPQKGMGYAA